MRPCANPGQRGRMSPDLDAPVTTVIRHRPLADAVGRYEDWLKEIALVARQFAGHHGVNVIRPHGAGDVYTIVLHFDTVENLRKWLASDTRVQLVRKIRPFLRSGENIDIKTGLEFWFTPPAGRSYPRPLKQFLVSLSAIFPLALLVPRLLEPLFRAVPVLGLWIPSTFITAAIIVGLMTYVVMPRYTRLVAGWLYR